MLKSAAKALVGQFGYEIRRAATATNCTVVDRLQWLESLRADISDASDQDRFAAFCAKRFTDSKSQLFQDLFVLFQTNEKRNGFFVEFGATDGVTLSNSYLLESLYGWRGLLAEPARGWHDALRANRTAEMTFDCVWSRTGETLSFRETEWKEISTIESFSQHDAHAKGRENGVSYEVNTVSLVDFLASHAAPAVIDYLSIDTEGSEHEILSAHDFDRWRFDLITVEHNFTENRGRIQTLLESKGYQRVFEALSRWDDWYVFRGR